jgi:hypothetical protein
MVLLITVGVVATRKATLNPIHLEPAHADAAHTKFLENAPKNMRRARWVHWAMIVQLVLSSVTSAVAVVEILRWLEANPP